jgi:hypothetical protein
LRTLEKAMPSKKPVDDISREEAYRDYVSHNIDQGWPYADKSGGSSESVENPAYGDPRANVDREPNTGFLVDEADASGVEERASGDVAPSVEALAESDDLEERIHDAIGALDLIQMELIDIHVKDGRVTIEGTVDGSATARTITAAVLRVPGVRTIVDNLRRGGVDSQIPGDS